MADSTVTNIINNNTQKSFILDIDGQKYELAIISFIANGDIYFYAIFKPTEYDHIIYSSEATKFWNTAKLNLRNILDEVCLRYSFDISNCQDIVTFTS